MTTISAPRAAVHDLLRLDSAAALRCDAPPPAWVEAALATAPWVIVRRALPRGELIPVGVRGAGRDQRWASWVHAEAVTAQLSPEALADRSINLELSRKSLPALAALQPLADLLAEYACPWGPTGSVGFELATGSAVVTDASDLDILMRADRRLPRIDAASLVRAVAGLDVRCDLLLETPAGGVALAEYARADGQVVARGSCGPRLVDDPWEAPILEPRS